jgi:hypothetical protein
MSTDTRIVYTDGALELPALFARLQPLLRDALVAAGFRQRESFEDLYELHRTNTASPHCVVQFGIIGLREPDWVFVGVGFISDTSHRRIAGIRIMSQRAKLCFAGDNMTAGVVCDKEYAVNDEADVVEAINRVFVDAGAPELCLSTTYVLK